MKITIDGQSYTLIPLDEPKPDNKIEARLEAFEGRLEALEHDSKEANTWGVRVNGDLHELHNRILRLEQNKKAEDDVRKENLIQTLRDMGIPEHVLGTLNKSTQPSDVGADARDYPHEKGVWVTISTLRNVVRTTDLVQGDIGLKALIKRLGLEE